MAGRTARPRTPAQPTGFEAFRARIEASVDPLYGGELVREGIEKDRDQIFTDPEFEPAVEARFAAIKAAFDRIRDRTPRR